MGMLAQLDSWLTAKTRTFSPGAVAVDPATLAFGVDTEQFSPTSYPEYLATSTGVYVCAKLRATLLASLPLKYYRLAKNGDRQEITSGALWQLTQKVNPYWTMNRLLQMTEMSLCAWGSAFWFVERGEGASGPPRELWWARPDRVRVFPHRENYIDHFEYQPAGGSAPIVFSPQETVWFRYVNPLDEYSGLSPLAAARLAADTQSAAMRSNRNMFSNGISLGGLITPSPNMPLSPEQGREIRETLEKRGKGVQNAHRWTVLTIDAKFQPLTMSPKDAEFVLLHKLTLEDIARSYGVPLDLIGGQRTYENVDAAQRIIWEHTMVPESVFIAAELTEQLLPMFGGSERVDLAEFDLSGVGALQEDESRKWLQPRLALQSGGITLNQFQELVELPGFGASGEVLYVSAGATPIRPSDLLAAAGNSPLLVDLPEPEPETTPALPEGETEEDDLERGLRALLAGTKLPALPMATRVAYDSDEHQRLYRLFIRRTTPLEARVKKVAVELFRRQQQSILTELGKVEDRASRAAEPDDADSLMAQIFSMARWRKEFRKAIKPILTLIATDAGQAALDEVTTGIGFDVMDPQVARFLESKAQKFAREVNQTTFDALKKSLVEGLEAGEGTDVLKERVREVMGARIRSSAEVIARTETITAYNGGTLEGWRQSGQVESKTWMSALDDRTRETHVDAHNQTVAIDGNFSVGDGSGPTPGQIGLPEEDIQCRCFMIAGLKVE